MSTYTPTASFSVTPAGEYVPSSDFAFALTAYSPSSDFVVRSGAAYTPTGDIAVGASGGGGGSTTYVTRLNQRWGARAVEQGEAVVSFGWLLDSYVPGSLPLSMAWQLEALPSSTIRLNQRWSKPAIVLSDLHLEQKWIGAPELQIATYGLQQAWGLMPFSVLLVGQRWSLEATAVWTKVISATAYLLTLERGEDRTQIPMANFSGQFRSGEPSYLQCSIPNAWTWADTVADYASQAGTEIVINAGYRWSDDSYTTQEIARVTLRNVRYDYGARSATVSLDGVDIRTNPAPKSVTLTGASYLNQDSDGRLRYRVQPQFDVRPGDTVTVNGDTFIVGELSYQVADNNAGMEVAEYIEQT